MKVLFAASEATPFISTGGLADVIGSLPSALCSKGIDARVVLPLYSGIPWEYRSDIHYICNFTVKLGWRNLYCGLFYSRHGNVTYYFIDNEYYFNRPKIYGEYDDAERFAFFSKAVLELFPYVDFYPDILHTNDWQTALAGIYLKQKYQFKPGYSHIKLVQTIHNIEYQGRYGFELFGDLFELDEKDREIVEYDGDINLLKGSIVCCDRLTTVSPRYADEIKTPEFSYYLDPILNRFYFKVRGILNGIDQNYYNPQNGYDIYAPYSSCDLSGKQVNKRAFQFDYAGKVKKVSTLLFDELDDILNITYPLEETNLSYKILESRKNTPFITRKEQKMLSFIQNGIEECYLQNNEKLNYLYYECFNQKCNSIDKAYHQLLEIIQTDVTETHQKLYELLLLSAAKKQ